MSVDGMKNLEKKVILHLKEYDSAPLNCTVSFMSRSLGISPDEVYEAVERLESIGAICSWEQWQKGAVKPYRIKNLALLMEQGVDFSLGEIRLLTQPIGKPNQEVAMTYASGIGGGKAGFMVSAWSGANLANMTGGLKQMNLGLALFGEDARRPAMERAWDMEIGYLDNFYASLFPSRETQPLYPLYHDEGEDLSSFTKRAVWLRLQALNTMSVSLLDRMAKGEGPRKAYILFFASMIERYLDLGKRMGIPQEHMDEASGIKDRIIAEAGEGK